MPHYSQIHTAIQGLQNQRKHQRDGETDQRRQDPSLQKGIVIHIFLPFFIKVTGRNRPQNRREKVKCFLKAPDRFISYKRKKICYSQYGKWVNQLRSSPKNKKTPTSIHLLAIMYQTKRSQRPHILTRLRRNVKVKGLFSEKEQEICAKVPQAFPS